MKDSIRPALEDEQLQAAAEHYDECWRNRIKFDRGDWWIVAALYLAVSGLAFVAL